ncbi:MAG: DUF1559 domain-containing protein, partial [Planctomycetota bacterium]
EATAAGADPDTWDAAPGWGWGTLILPFLEQDNIYDGLTLELPLWHTANAAFVDEKLPVFLCPSATGGDDAFVVRELDDMWDDTQPLPPPVTGLPNQPAEIFLGRTHYVASHGQESCWGDCGGTAGTVNVFVGNGPATTPVDVFGDVSKMVDGPFYRNSSTRFRDVTDGLSNTIFLGEHSSFWSDKTWVGVVPGAGTTPRVSNPDNGPDTAATLTLVHAGPSGGEVDSFGQPIIHPVNFPAFHVGQMYSEHVGGGQICLGDGTVRFISENIDLFVFANLSSMDEGEVLGEF